MKTSKEGVVLIGELLTRYGQGGSCYESKAPSAYHNSFIVVDRTEAWVVETVGRFWAAELVKGNYYIVKGTLTSGMQTLWTNLGDQQTRWSERNSRPVSVEVTSKANQSCLICFCMLLLSCK